jgi:hypothetical protein
MKMEQAIRAIQDMDNGHGHSSCSFSASYASYFFTVASSCPMN